MRYWKNAKLNLKEFNLTSTGCDKVGLAITKSLWSAISSCASYDYTEAMTGSIQFILSFSTSLFLKWIEITHANFTPLKSTIDLFYANSFLPLCHESENC